MCMAVVYSHPIYKLHFFHKTFLCFFVAAIFLDEKWFSFGARKRQIPLFSFHFQPIYLLGLALSYKRFVWESVSMIRAWLYAFGLNLKSFSINFYDFTFGLFFLYCCCCYCLFSLSKWINFDRLSERSFSLSMLLLTTLLLFFYSP